MKKAEYYIAQLPDVVQKNGSTLFKVAKFSGGAEPEAIYFVKYYKKDNIMSCDCPNRRRSAHINDKHGQMVAKWMIAGRPEGFFDEKGDFHARPE